LDQKWYISSLFDGVGGGAFGAAAQKAKASVQRQYVPSRLPFCPLAGVLLHLRYDLE